MPTNPRRYVNILSCEVSTQRGRTTPTGVTGGTGSSAAPLMNMSLTWPAKAAAAEAPPVTYSVVGHTPLHRTLEVGQSIGGQCIDCFGDVSLRMRKTGDVREDGLVTDGRFRGARPASHNCRQCPRRIALGRLLSAALAAVHGETLFLPDGQTTIAHAQISVYH